MIYFMIYFIFINWCESNMIIFQISLKSERSIYKICSLSGLILYQTSKYPSIRKICKRLGDDYIIVPTSHIDNIGDVNEILVVKDDNKKILLDIMSRYRRTDYFYKKICSILKIYCYKNEYELIYKLIQLDARFIKFYLGCTPVRLHKYISYNTECYKYLPIKIRNNKQFIITVLGENINITPYLISKYLKDIDIANQVLINNPSNINYLILVYDITPLFINWCESIHSSIFSYVKVDYLFRLTQSPNGIYAIPLILFRCSEYLTIQFFKFDMRATVGVNIREILKNNPDAKWLQHAHYLLR
jgi:hypothetical protein